MKKLLGLFLTAQNSNFSCGVILETPAGPKGPAEDSPSVPSTCNVTSYGKLLKQQY
jgi:hypothetical protein